MQPPVSPEQLEFIRSGQRRLVLTIPLQITLIIAVWFLGMTNISSVTSGLIILLSLPISIAAKIIGISGILRVCRGLNYTLFWRFLFCLLMFVFVASFFVLVALNSKAADALRENGYEVGLFRVKRRYPPKRS